MPCMLSGKRIHALGPTCIPTLSLHLCQEFSATIGGTAHSQEAKTRPTTPPQASDTAWARCASGRTKGRRAGCITEIFATHRTKWRSEDCVQGPAKIKERSQVAQAIRSILTDLFSIINSSHASATASATKTVLNRWKRACRVSWSADEGGQLYFMGRTKTVNPNPVHAGGRHSVTIVADQLVPGRGKRHQPAT